MGGRSNEKNSEGTGGQRTLTMRRPDSATTTAGDGEDDLSNSTSPKQHFKEQVSSLSPPNQLAQHFTFQT